MPPRQRQLVEKLIEAARPMDPIFWEQTYGNLDSLMASIDDPGLRRLVEINYGPWDRLGDNAPLVEGVGTKPPGANLYPQDMSRSEFQAALDAPASQANALRDLYTLVEKGARRFAPSNTLPRGLFAEHVQTVAQNLRKAAELRGRPWTPSGI